MVLGEHAGRRGKRLLEACRPWLYLMHLSLLSKIRSAVIEPSITPPCGHESRWP